MVECEWFLSFAPMYMTRDKRNSMGDAYVIMNIKIPDSIVE